MPTSDPPHCSAFPYEGGSQGRLTRRSHDAIVARRAGFPLDASTQQLSQHPVVPA